MEILTLHLAYFSYGNKPKLGADGEQGQDVTRVPVLNDQIVW